MGKLSRALSGALVVFALAACRDPLTVENTNNPDRDRVLARPSDVEVLIKGTFKSVFNGTFNTNGINPSMRTMSWENASNLNNYGMGPRSSIPRAFIDNNRGNSFLLENRYDWSAVNSGLRSAADGLSKMEGLTLGSAAQNARARAYGWFGLGVAMGYLAMAYDSSSIVDPHVDITIIPDLSGYAEVNAAALKALDSALAWTTTAKTVAGGYGTNVMLDATWINGITFTADQFTQFVRSYKAYFRANVARTPGERAAVDWAKVRDDAAAGITVNLLVTTGSGTGWGFAGNQWFLYGQWGQLSQLIGGMADSSCVTAAGALVACGTAGSSRAYDNWLALADADKVQFLIRTPDLRFPQGITRALQNVDTANAAHYFRNRKSGDSDAAPFSSYYDWIRMLAWYNNSSTGPHPFFVKAQNDLLRAEALIRLGDIAGAATLIDITRVANGLAPLSGAWAATATASTPVPGGNACVPHVPQSPTYTVTACGTIMEAMKWEYRLETMYVSYASQYFSGRGWGDLAEGTPLQWPVPYQEMDARLHPFYNMGGVGRAGGAVGKGNYGY